MKAKLFIIVILFLLAATAAVFTLRRVRTVEETIVTQPSPAVASLEGVIYRSERETGRLFRYDSANGTWSAAEIATDDAGAWDVTATMAATTNLEDGEKNVELFDLSDLSSVARIAVAPVRMAVSPSSKYLMTIEPYPDVANECCRLAVYMVKNGQQVFQYKRAVSGAASCDWSADSRKFIFVSRGGGEGSPQDNAPTVVIYDWARLAEQTVTTGEDAVFGPDGKNILVRRSNALIVHNVETGVETALFDGEFINQYIWSPSGASVLIWKGQQGKGEQLIVVDVAHADQRTVIYRGACGRIDWSR